MTDSEGSAPIRVAVPVIYLLFFLSGFCGLVYEVLWLRHFSISFGNTTYAATVVLSAFMGGLALGSRFFGRLVDKPTRRSSLLSYYGWMEIGVGLYCLGFERLIGLQDKGLLWFYHSFEPGAAAGLAVKFLCSALLLLLPTTLMGGTLPILIKKFSRSLPEVGRVTGRLYFINCFGAVLGSLAVAFWLIPHWGMELSNAVAAGINIVVGVIALGFRGSSVDQEAPAGSATTAGGESPTEVALSRVMKWSLVGIFLCGSSAMIYEISWIRLLSMVLGSSTYSFSLMVAAFITGISLGSLIISRFDAGIKNPPRVFALCQLVVAAAVLASLPLYSRLPLFFIRSRELVNFSYEAHQAFKFVICFLVMCIPTTAIGMGFPLVSRLAADGLNRVAGKVGGVYALNTLGNILGSVLCGLVLIPLLGLKVTLETGVFLNLAAGLALLFALGPGYSASARKILAAAVGVVAFYYLLAPGWDRALLTSGAFRYRPDNSGQRAQYTESPGDREIIFYREGISTTVSVERSDTILTLRVNGKPDASTSSDLSTQYLLGHLPMLLHPRPGRALVIGVGSGITCGAVLAHPELEKLYCVDISPGVIQGSRFFADYNRRYWEDPRAEVVVDDGRNFLLRCPERFEVISSEPSNPWVAGIGSLYTEEFYLSCRDHLTRDGVFCQWVHLYEMKDDLLKIILQTFMKVFPGAMAFTSLENSDILLIGRIAEPEYDFDSIARRLSEPEVSADLASIGIKSLFNLLTTQIFDPSGMSRWVWITQVNTDNFPLVEYQAPRGFFEGSQVKLPTKYRFAKNETLLGEYLRQHRVGVEELVELARYQMNSGLAVIVYSALSDALELEPDNREALGLMARLLLESREYHRAGQIIEAYAAAGAKEKEVLELKFRVALALAELRSASFVRQPDFSHPLELKLRLAEIDSTRSHHPYHLGEIYHRLSSYHLAAAAFEKALELRAAERDPLTPDPWFIMLRIGKCFLDAEDFDRAAWWYTRVIETAPDQPLGPDMLRIVFLERLRAEGGPLDIDRLKQILEE